MSFFQLSTGQNAQSTGEFDAGGGDFEPIPNNTNVLAVCEEAKIDDYEGENYINTKWRIAQPEEYKNRVIFQKLKVFDEKETIRDKAIQLLAAIDANCGGKLAKSGQTPTDLSLQKSIIGRPMVLKLLVWTIYGKGEDGKDDKSKIEKTGNRIGAVSPAKKGIAQPEQAPAKQDKAPAADMPNTADMGDDIPF